jgi:uncharacterized protein YeaC (DUF1315 family)
MATFNDFEQRKKENEMAREQRGSCVYIYILFTMEKNKKKKNMINKRQTITKFKSERAQETEYKLKKK